MKRIFIALALVFCMLLSIVACAPQVDVENTSEQISEDETEKKTQVKSEDSTEQTIGKQTENSIEKPTEATTEKPTEAPTENPAGELTEEPTEENTERLTEKPDETEIVDSNVMTPSWPEISVEEKIAEIFNSVPEEPVCRVENTLVEMIMSGKIEGQDFYAEVKNESVERIKNTDGMTDCVKVKKERSLTSVEGYSEFNEYTQISGKVGEYELYGYIPGVSAGGQAVFQKWIVERDGEESGTEESSGNIYEDTGFAVAAFIFAFDKYSLEEEDGIFVIEFSDYNGENGDVIGELFGDSIASEAIKDLSIRITINSESYLPVSMDVDFDIDGYVLVGADVAVEASVRIWCEYYDENYNILPDNYDKYVLVGDMSYRDIVIEEIDYYFSDLTAFESLSFETISSVDLYYSIDGSSRDIAVSTSEKDVVNLGYYDGEFVYAIDADMTVMDESQKIKMLYKDGAFSMYINGELVNSQSIDVSDAAAILDRSYYDQISFEAYEIADIKVTNDPEGTKTVVLKSDYSIRVRETIKTLGFEKYELINEAQEYTVLLDEDNYLLALEYKVSGEFKDADGVTYYIESTSAIGIIGDADFSALNVNLPSIGA